MWGKTKKELEAIRNQLAELSKRLEVREPSIGDKLIEGMAGILQKQAEAAPRMQEVLADFSTRMLEGVRKDAMRQMASNGGKKSGQVRKGKKLNLEIEQKLKDMADDCSECHGNLHGVDWTDRPVNDDYARHKNENHDKIIEKLVRQLAPVEQRNN